MSRANYHDDDDSDYPAALWRGAVASAIRGKRGQRFLREFVEALDALPEKKLAAESFTKDVCPCSLGAVAIKRGIDVSALEPDEYDEVDQVAVSSTFGVAEPMTRQIMYENDEGGPWRAADETPEQRWVRMRAWAVKHIAAEPEVKS